MSSHGVQENIFQEFILEIKEDLARLEPDLLSLEAQGDGVEDDLINRAFRTIHSIKGGAGFIDHPALSEQAHAMENTLMSLRDKTARLTPGMADDLVTGLDKMKLLVGRAPSDIQGGLSPVEGAVPISDDALSEMRISLKSMEPNPLFVGQVFSVSRRALEAALARKQFIYGVRPSPGHLSRLEADLVSIGDCLSPRGDPPVLGEPSNMVIASILDKPLVAKVLDLPQTHVVFLDRQFTDISKAFDLSGGTSFTQASLTAPRVKVNLDLLSRLMDRAGELVLARNQFRPLMEEMGQTHPQAAILMQSLDMVTSDIQETIMQLRMQPVATLFNKYRRVVRDMGRRLDKQVEFRIRGGAVEVDRNILEGLANPLTHLIRNAMDHGIESPEQRLVLGKPLTGTLEISATHQSGHIRIDIMDDGAGMDPDEILDQALARGVIALDRGRRLSDKEKLNLIFLPGFSTSEAVTDISGRGVGMDVVKTNVERLRGYIELDATKGEGTRVMLTIPLTLAIVPSLIVGEGQTLFAIPRADVKEVVHIQGKDLGRRVENIAGQEVLKLRDQLYPVLRLSHVLDIPIYYTDPVTGQKRIDRRRYIADRRVSSLDNGVKRLLGLPSSTDDTPHVELRQKNERRKKGGESVHVILLKLGSQCFGLLVADLFDIEETVVEPLSDYLKGVRYFAGSTILGNGQVVMVLDVNGIASGACLAFDSIRSHLEDTRSASPKHSTAKQDFLVFENGPNEFFGLPLTAVSRLEPIYTSSLHQSGEMVFVQFDDRAWRLIRLDDFLPVNGLPRDADPFYCLFLKHSNPPVGVCARSVVDTIRVAFKPDPLELDSDTPVQGTIFTRGMMVQVLNPQALVENLQWQKPMKDFVHEANSHC